MEPSRSRTIDVSDLTFEAAPQLPFLGYLEAHYAGDGVWCETLAKSLTHNIIVVGAFTLMIELVGETPEPWSVARRLALRAGAEADRANRRDRARVAFLGSFAQGITRAESHDGNLLHFDFPASAYTRNELLDGLGYAIEQAVRESLAIGGADISNAATYVAARDSVLADLRASAMKRCAQ